MPELDPATREHLETNFPPEDIGSVIRGVKASIEQGDTPDTPEALRYYVISCLLAKQAVLDAFRHHFPKAA